MKDFLLIEMHEFSTVRKKTHRAHDMRIKT